MQSDRGRVWVAGGKVSVRVDGLVYTGRWETADPGLLRVWYGLDNKTTEVGESDKAQLVRLLLQDLVRELVDRKKKRPR